MQVLESTSAPLGASLTTATGGLVLLCLWGAIPWLIWLRVRDRHPADFPYVDSEVGPMEIDRYHDHSSPFRVHHYLRLSLRAHGYIWSLRFRERGDSWLSGLCWTQIALDVAGLLLATWQLLPQLRLFLEL